MKSKPKDVSSENKKHKAYLTKTANFFHTPVCQKASKNQAILKFSSFTCSSVLTVFVTFVYFFNA